MQISFAPLRLAAALCLATVLAACGGATSTQDFSLDDEPMGNFRLGHAVVKIDDPQVGPVSRRVSDDVWKAAMDAAMQRRFAAYEGDQFYHLGVSLDGYSLNPPGPPMITPKSQLIFTVTMLDDTGRKLNDDGQMLTVFEEFGTEFVVGSGFSRTAEEQVEILTFRAAEAIQNWIQRNPEWVGLPPLPQGNAGADGDA